MSCENVHDFLTNCRKIALGYLKQHCQDVLAQSEYKFCGTVQTQF